MKKISLFALLTLNMLFAVTLVPLTETMDSKKQKNTTFKINNPTGEPVAVDFSVLKLTDTDNNKEQREISQNVSYYPSQFVLMPNETKNVRVKYIGTDLPATEEVYRVIAKELDVDVSEKNSTAPKGKISASIKMRFSYEGLLFVKRADAKPNLAIESFEKLPKGGISILISNSGNASDVPNMALYNFFAKVDGKEYMLQEKDFANAEFRRILPNKKNTFFLKHIALPKGNFESIRIEKKL